MQRKPLTTIQSYFVGSIVFMHLLFGIYYLSTDPDEKAGTDTTEARTLVLDHVKVSSNRTSIPETSGPQPPEAGHLNLAAMKLVNDRYTVPMAQDWQATLTLDPSLQSFADRLLKRSKVPAGAIVALDIATAEVLVLAQSYDENHPVAPMHDGNGPTHLALRRTAPSASVFKIVSAAALLDRGLNPKKTHHYKYAKRRITKRHLVPSKQNETADLASAIAMSNNGYFAALSSRLLTQNSLYEMANRFGFNDAIPFAAMVEPSLANVPNEPLELARMSAGFWHSYLTPLHAANIVHTIANAGRFKQPRLVKNLQHTSGNLYKAPARDSKQQVISTEQAKVIAAGLRKTLTHGTGRRSFAKWPNALKEIHVYGKTGTLGARQPDRTYTWFVGYLRGSHRDIAIAVLAINGSKWWRKAPQIAKDLLVHHARSRPATASRTSK